jgi:hypothetical protein
MVGITAYSSILALNITGLNFPRVGDQVGPKSRN